jgi:hypothetical protein
LITVPTGKFAFGPYHIADSQVSAPPFPPLTPAAPLKGILVPATDST